jgi:hypothetical protein
VGFFARQSLVERLFRPPLERWRINLDLVWLWSFLFFAICISNTLPQKWRAIHQPEAGTVLQFNQKTL